jgi:murein DD-endopeptidase MepM/ murein hydrolase activator NlpD
VRSQPGRVAGGSLAAGRRGVETVAAHPPQRARTAGSSTAASGCVAGTGAAAHAGGMKVFLLVVALIAVLAAAPNGARADAVGPAVWPLDPTPTVVRGFEPPDDPWGAGHRGVDLLGSPGQAVRTALAGTVTFAGTLAGRGVVVVSHGATRTTYEPVDAVVAVGDVLPTGGVIGTLQTGLSHCFPRTCLHWGLLRGETYLDPLSLLGVTPVRLLPLALFSQVMPWGAPAGMPLAVVPR